MLNFFSKKSNDLADAVQSFSSISEEDSLEQQKRFSAAFAAELYREDPILMNRYSFSPASVDENYSSVAASYSPSDDSKLFNPTYIAIKFFCEKLESIYYPIRKSMPLEQQFSGSLLIKKDKKLASEKGAVSEWVMELNEFSGNVTWLLSHQHKKFYRIEVNNLLVETEREKFRHLLNSILNIPENIPERLRCLFNQLEHLNDAVHPFTGERMSLSIATQYDKERTENQKNNEKTLYFSFILSKITQPQDLFQESLRL